MARNIDSVVCRLVQGCKSMEEVSNRIFIRKLLSLYFAECSITCTSISLSHLLKQQTWYRISSVDRAERDETSHGTRADKSAMTTVRRSACDRTISARSAMLRPPRKWTSRTCSHKTGSLRALRAAGKDTGGTIVLKRKQEMVNHTVDKWLHLVL